jgi:fructokinase
MPLWGGIEAGGTKTVCAIGTGPEDLRAEVRFPTTTPAETIQQVIQFFREQAREEPLAAVGIASFGPLDLDPQSPRFGYITSTPKPGWACTDLAESVGQSLGTPVGFDTDVNAAALGEHQWGAARGLDDFVYLTVGTGIGGGAMVNGRLTHGLSHPEMGHIRIPHDRALDPFEGSCPYHGDCLEGLASGPALEARWGQPGWRHARRGSPSMAPRGRLPGLRCGEPDLYPSAPAHHHGGRHHASTPDLSPPATEDARAAQRLPASAGDPGPDR